MDGLKLYQGDMKRIADNMLCHKKSVEQILKGERGKRNTKFQEFIKRVAQLRSEQNRQFEEVCNQFKAELITLKSVK